VAARRDSRPVRGLGAAHHCRQTRITASFGGQLFRYPRTVENTVSPPPAGGGSDLSRRFEVGGTLVATARRFMRGRGSE
jgi:hypothetical protein